MSASPLPEFRGCYWTKSEEARMEEMRTELKSFHPSDLMFWKIATGLASRKLAVLKADTQYWKARLLELQNKGHLEDEDEEENLAQWTETITTRTKAAWLKMRLYELQAAKVDNGGVVPEEFVSLAKSYLGIATENAGVVAEPTRADRVNFRQSLLTAYDAGIHRITHDNGHHTGYRSCIFDCVSGEYQNDSAMVVTHIVPPKLGQETITALFPFDSPPDLLSPDNGVIVPHAVAEALNNGALAIVPNLADEDYKSPEALAEWEASSPREYKWIIVDEAAEDILNAPYAPGPDINGQVTFLTVRQLDNKPLHFRPDCPHRPSTRLLFFAYVFAVLKTIWRSDDLSGIKVIAPEIWAKTMWTRKNRYLYLNQALFVCWSRELFQRNEDGVNIRGNVPRLLQMLRGVSIEEAKEKTEVALLALARAFEVRQTKLEEEMVEEAAEEEYMYRLGDEEFNWNGARLPYWQFGEEELEEMGEGQDEEDDDDDDDGNEDEIFEIMDSGYGSLENNDEEEEEDEDEDGWSEVETWSDGYEVVNHSDGESELSFEEDDLP